MEEGLEKPYPYGNNNINSGILFDVPGIAIDHFYGPSLTAQYFFLSHAHTDHMVGLETTDFLRSISNDPDKKLFCHVITPILLQHFREYLGGKRGLKRLIKSGKLIPLETNVKYDLKLKAPCKNDDGKVVETFSVTLLPAGHCPGSVMFLFETDDFRILHTADFRLTVQDFKAMPSLFENNCGMLKLKKIDHLYIDTTFCSHSAAEFPCRMEAIDNISNFLRKWLSQAPQNAVIISFAAKFCHEFILIDLFKRFGYKTHVSSLKWKIFKDIPELNEVVTLDHKTPFHLCDKNVCPKLSNGDPVKVLRLASMWYVYTCEKNKSNAKRYMSVHGNTVKLCYSMHSSLQETAEAIDYLKPQVVSPLVMPVDGSLCEVREVLASRTNVPYYFQEPKVLMNMFGGTNQQNGESSYSVAVDSAQNVPTTAIDAQNEALWDSCALTTPTKKIHRLEASRISKSSESSSCLADETLQWSFDCSP